MFGFLTSHFTYGQTAKETQTIVEEILTISEKYTHTWETLNVEQIATYHANENFLYWGHGELVCKSNDDFRKTFSKILPMMKKWTVKEISRLSVQVLNEHAAIACFLLDAESIGLDGTKSNHGSGALTYVWNKVNDKWKLVHIHESAKK